MSNADDTTDDLDEAPPSAWSPLYNKVFLALWLAQLFSNIGTWMQNVGAAWLMGDLGGSPMEVSLVQTATSLPVFAVGLLAGAVADIVDRRKLLLLSQLWMLVAAGALAWATHVDAINPLSLLAFTFALGLGSAMTLPAWQAIQPELIPRGMLPQAVGLSSVAMNVGRAVGPALGGLVVAAAGPEAVFGLNAVSFLGILAVIAWWKRPVEEHPLPSEKLWSAIRAGVRYSRNSPALRGVLIRSALFVLPSSAVLALLPVVARDGLGLGSGGFGVLLAAFGIGAIAMAPLLPRARLLGVDRLVVASSLVSSLVLVVMAYVDNAVAVAVVASFGGAAWVSAMSTFNVSAQSVLPAWVRARGMGLYLLVFQGNLAIGSALWGVIAGRQLAASLTLAALFLVVSVWSTKRWRLQRERAIDVRPQSYWPEPITSTQVQPAQGPVLIVVEYRIVLEREEEFRSEMERVRRLRHRTGAHRWGLYRDSAQQDLLTETFVVDSWEEHLRQHQRTTATDQQIQDRVRALLVPGTAPETKHLIWAY